MVMDMEGVDGVFNEDLQVTPNKSPRWEECLEMFTDEINAPVAGLPQSGWGASRKWEIGTSGRAWGAEGRLGEGPEGRARPRVCPRSNLVDPRLFVVVGHVPHVALRGA